VLFTRFAAAKGGARRAPPDGPAREELEANPKRRARLLRRRLTQSTQTERSGGGKTHRCRKPTQRQNTSGRSSRSPKHTRAPTSPWTCTGLAGGGVGDPARGRQLLRGFEKTKVRPDLVSENLAFDSHGNLWISRTGNALD